MRVNEIVFEDTSAEDQLGSNSPDAGSGTLIANLVPVLMFLKKRSEDKELSPKLRMDSLIQLVQNAGDNTFTYEDFIKAHQTNDAVKGLVKDYNENEIILRSSSDDASELKADDEESDSEADAEDSQKVVQQMAKSARAKREE